MKRKRISLLILAGVVFCLLFLLQRNFLPGGSSRENPKSNLTLLNTIIQLIKSDYISDPDPVATMEGAFRGLADSLDPLSTYLNKEDTIKYLQWPPTGYADIGTVLFKTFGSLPQVVGLIEGSPAEKAGIQRGDYISAIDGKSTFGMSLLEVQLDLMEKELRPVKVKVVKPRETKEMEVERIRLFPEPCTLTPAERTLGVLSIHNLREPCAHLAEEKISAALKEEGTPLILDLRTCWGGDIREARKLINLFLKAEKAGSFQKSKDSRIPFSCPEKPAFKDLPLVVWVGPSTIGPAEIVAGVLQNFKRARVIGAQTIGLTAIQDFFVLEDGSSLLLTSGLFSLDSDLSLWENGVKPGVVLDAESLDRKTLLRKTLEDTSSSS